jgi:hypothetical protein
VASAVHGLRLAHPPVLIALGLAWVVFSGVGIDVDTGLLASSSSGLNAALRNETGSVPETIRQRQLEPRYRAALRAVKDPDRAILAVDRPFLVDYSRYDMPTLDMPGAAAPGGRFPFFTGPLDKITTLRRNGFDTLVATIPAREVCLAVQLSVFRTGSQQRTGNFYDRYLADWATDLAEISRKAPGAVQSFRPLWVIDLKRAQRVFEHRRA